MAHGTAVVLTVVVAALRSVGRRGSLVVMASSWVTGITCAARGCSLGRLVGAVDGGPASQRVNGAMQACALGVELLVAR